jgi:hypothetical protein
MGAGGPGRWEIVADETAISGKALAQLNTDKSEHRFLTAYYKPAAFLSRLFLPGGVGSGRLTLAGWIESLHVPATALMRHSRRRNGTRP